MNEKFVSTGILMVAAPVLIFAGHGFVIMMEKLPLLMAVLIGIVFVGGCCVAIGIKMENT